ncbi:nitrile hydratase [Nocardia transvalensis]|uniref:nitrile hydratase n=1 Tax=Nocardia transvalensis TaxID=37333 RepID=UPI001893B100|nr:nitrile hydratase [Nocardia transvalensis]MBF6332225.1 nitrile hydratase [Nocardia transvalensis]
MTTSDRHPTVPAVAREDLEAALTWRAWTDPGFADQCGRDPHAALAALGVQVPEGTRVRIRVQRRDTLYFVIPPAREPDQPHTHEVVNQMDLWRSSDLFVWLLPEDRKIDLLAMRRSFRTGASSDSAPRPTDPRT